MKYFASFLLLLLLHARCAKDASKPAVSGTLAYANVDGGVNHLYLMDIDQNYHGGNSRRITTNIENEDYPSWSPDGIQIAFQLSRDGSAIYTVNQDGTGLTRLSPAPGYDVTPSWSPDGKKIIYARVLDQFVPNEIPRTEIRVMNVDGTDDHPIHF